MIAVSTIHLLAADLAGSNIDPNEASKALSYLRSKRDPKQFFKYLRAINTNGAAVIRSAQTLSYYRNLLEVCERHLQDMHYEEMSQTLGWAIRLMRYYKAVPDSDQALKAALEEIQKEEPKSKSKGIPQVGEIFIGKVDDLDDEVVLIQVHNFPLEQVAGILRAEQIENGRTSRYRKGNSARVEVIDSRTTKKGRTILELKPAPKVLNEVK
jgi:hypothetical protein